MKKRFLLLTFLCLVSSLPLIAMEQDDDYWNEEDFSQSAFAASAVRGPVDPWRNDPNVQSVRTALELQLEDAIRSQDVSTLLDLQYQLIIHDICSAEDIALHIQRFTEGFPVSSSSSSSSSSLSEVQRQRIEEDRRIMEEQRQAYDESLRKDREKEMQQNEAACVIQNIVRAQHQQKRYRQALHSMKVENYLQEQFDFTRILDECIAQLAKSENIQANFGKISFNLGDDMRLIPLFARARQNILPALQQANQQSYETERDHEQALCNVVAQKIEGDEILAQRRAVRIVENFLGHALQPQETHEETCAAQSLVSTDVDSTEEQEETDENVHPAQLPAPMTDIWVLDQEELRILYNNALETQDIQTLARLSDQFLAYNIIGSENDLKVLIEGIQNQQLQSRYLNAIADNDLETLQEIRELVIHHGIASEEEIDHAIDCLLEQSEPQQEQNRQEGTGQSFARWASTGRGAAVLGAGLVLGYGVIRYLRR